MKLSEEKVKHLEKQLIRQERGNSLKDKNLQEMMQSRDKAISECETLKQEVKNSKNKTQQKVGGCALWQFFMHVFGEDRVKS